MISRHVDILRHSIRKLRTYEEIHTALLGIFVAMAFIASCQQEGTLSAGGNDSYWRTW